MCVHAQLHRPADPGVDHFWVDFNLSSESLAMFVEDPYFRGGNNPEDSMWEYVVIRKNSLKHWTVEGITTASTINGSKPTHRRLQ